MLCMIFSTMFQYFNGPSKGDLSRHDLRLYFHSCLSVVCFDAKINFDDNASFRQKEVFAMDDMAETDPREIEASRLKLNYIALEGSIGCLGLLNIRHDYLSS